MDILLGTVLLVISTLLFFFLISIFRKSDSFERFYRLLFAEVTTEISIPLARITPLKAPEVSKIVCTVLQVPDYRKPELKETLKQVLRATVFKQTDAWVREESFQIELFAEILKRIEAGSCLPANAKEIMVTQAMHRFTRRVSENVRFMEDLLPPALGLVLWKIFLIDRAQDFLMEIEGQAADPEGFGEHLGKWLDTEDIAKHNANREHLKQISAILRSGNIAETDFLASRFDHIEREQLRMMKAIHLKISGIKDDPNVLASDAEELAIEVAERYESALKAYLCVFQIRLFSAALCSFAPSIHKPAKACVENCRKILEEESGHLTMMFKIMDTIDTENFINISLEHDEEPSAVLSLLYPSFILQELMKWYKRHRIAERAAVIKGRLQLRFTRIIERLNELMKAASDTGLYTEDPLKGTLSILVSVDGKGEIRDIKKVLEVHPD